MSPKVAKDLFMKDMAKAEQRLNGVLKVDVSPEIKTVLLDMAFNVNDKAFKNTVEMVNKGDEQGAVENISKIVYSRNQKLAGLEKRAKARVDLFKKGMAKSRNEQMLFGNFEGM